MLPTHQTGLLLGLQIKEWVVARVGNATVTWAGTSQLETLKGRHLFGDLIVDKIILKWIVTGSSLQALPTIVMGPFGFTFSLAEACAAWHQ